jgi:hypothetical protein
MLLAAGRSPEEQFDLLDRARCLTRNGRADRPGVIALIEQAASEYRPTIPDRPQPPGTPSETVYDAIDGALLRAGYTDIARWTALENPAGCDHLERIIAELRAVGDVPRSDPASTSPSRDITCPRCQRPLPATAMFCGYCGSRLSQATFISR